MIESDALTFLAGDLLPANSGDELDWVSGRLPEDARWSFFLAFLLAWLPLFTPAMLVKCVSGGIYTMDCRVSLIEAVVGPLKAKLSPKRDGGNLFY